MLESILPALAHGKPTDSVLTRAAWLAVVLAAVPSGLVMLTGGQSVGDYVIVLLLITIVALGVFAWGVPSALELRAPGPSVAAVALSGLGLVTVLLYWTGVAPLLAVGGILLGRTQLDVPEDRHRARLAVWVGVAALVLYLLLSVLDLLT
jgi:hypothetical protein